MSHYQHIDGSWCDEPGPVHRDVVATRTVACYGHDRILVLAPEGQATPAARLAALAQLADAYDVEADRLDDERGENEYDPEAEATAEALRTAAQAVLSILHPDVDLESSAAAQTYIESGCWPTRTEIEEHRA